MSMKTLSLLHIRGRKKLLNIKIKNESIELVKIKRYLDVGEIRLQWASIADRLMEKNLTRK